MPADVWLPLSHALPDGSEAGKLVQGGLAWQIVETRGGGRALIVEQSLAQRWINSGLLGDGVLADFSFGERHLRALTSPKSQLLTSVSESRSPNNQSEAVAFAQALKATRAIDGETPLQDALYVERYSRLLPTYSITSRTDDAIVLGYWLTGGANVSAGSFRRLAHMLSWMDNGQVKDVVESAGFAVEAVVPESAKTRTRTKKRVESGDEPIDAADDKTKFELPGRPELEAFFNEYVIDLVRNRERYKALGVSFPAPIILHGPTGTGKTYAVDRLTEFLGWPSFAIDASSVASPYIHETSKKVAAVFEKAMEAAPAVLKIDEMDAYLSERNQANGQHRVEEVAEFLRQIPEAVKHDVLVVAMTNRIDMIDQAILRRGRFDHVLKVDFAGEEEILSLLQHSLGGLPTEADVDAKPLAQALAGHPLSDVAYVVREGARLAARAGRATLNQESLLAALKATPARDPDAGEKRRIGFV